MKDKVKTKLKIEKEKRRIERENNLAILEK